MTYLSHLLYNNFDDNRDGLFLYLLSNIRKYMLYVWVATCVETVELTIVLSHDGY